MEQVFLSIINMSFTASFIIAAIMLARLPLKKAPKLISYALWVVAGFRLIFPFTLESVFSLLPFNTTPVPQDIAMQAVPRINSGIVAIDNAVSVSLPAATPMASVNPLQIWIALGCLAWIVGVAAMLIYSIVSIILLKRRLRFATWVEGNLYEASNLKTPFVIGLFRPRIYIPSELSDDERSYIVLHERTHIRRGDHIIKLFAYFVLCLHWFNPFAWAAFVLMGADMEMSCDERVMRELGGEIKNAYSLSLVRVAAGRRILNGSPLAFGEGGMKERVKNVLNFKKHSRVIIIAAVVLVAVLSIGFAVNQSSDGGIWRLIRPMTMSTVGREPHFSGIIVEAYDNSILVKVNEGEDARRSSDLIDVSLDVKLMDSIDVFMVGDEVIVYYDGMIAESYPAQVRNVYAIVLLNREHRLSSNDVIEWLDFYNSTELPWDGSREIELPEYPGVVFRWTSGEVTAIDASGVTTLFTGMPIWNVYLADLNDDGMREIYATVSMGSGVIDTHIVAYDYANGTKTVLEDRMVYDYYLSLEDGQLVVTQTNYFTSGLGDPRGRGYFEYVNDELTVVGIDRNRPEEGLNGGEVPSPKDQLTAYLAALFTEAYSSYYDEMRFEISDYSKTIDSGDFTAYFLWSMRYVSTSYYDAPSDIGKEQTVNFGLMVTAKIDTDGRLTNIAAFNDSSAVGEPDHFSVEDFFPPKPSDGTVLYTAKLTHDGSEQTIVLQDTYMPNFYTLQVRSSDGMVLCTLDAGSSHMGWNTVLLTHIEGKDYLMQYNPTMYQGNCFYSFSVFSFDGNGEAVALDSDSIEFSINSPAASYSFRRSDAEPIKAFYEHLNKHLAQSELLITSDANYISHLLSGADGGYELYSTPYIIGSQDVPYVVGKDYFYGSDELSLDEQLELFISDFIHDYGEIAD